MTKMILDLKFHQPQRFRYFWIKYVRGFDPSRHCARCLIGEYSSLLAYRKHTDLVRAVLDEHAAPLVYICGVTAKWEWNVHVAGRLEPGELTEYADERVGLQLENFRRIEIRPDLGPPAPKTFTTCRNWQFGWTAFPETLRDVELKQ